MMENNVRLSLVISQGDPMIFLTRPISAGLMVLTFILLVSPFIPWIGRRRKKLHERVRGEGV
jgi:putative tricarboxylic transport membrane protein